MLRELGQIAKDTVSIARSYEKGPVGPRQVAAAALQDGSLILALTRVREAARNHRVPLMGTAVRRLQTALFGIEISKSATLGEGVVFMHTVGIVIGGDSRVGDRVWFLGSNTLGSVDARGYPTIGNDVIIGAGARILGAVTVGDGATIAANAVVLSDIPPGALAVGIPAVVKRRGDGESQTALPRA
jgi:serine acetyltransferase